MKLRVLAASVAALTLAAGIASAQDTASEKGKLSYYFGYDFGRSLAESGESIDVNTLVKAVQDGYAKKQPSLTAEQLKPAVEAFQKRQQAKAAAAKAEYDKAAAENKTKSNTFLGQFKGQGARTLANGIAYKVTQAGNGAKPAMGSTVALEVAGPFPWGQRPAAGQPGSQAQSIPAIKISEVEMPAMREVLMQMPAGSRWEVALPPERAFGADPRTGFPPNVAVVFDIKLVSVK